MENITTITRYNSAYELLEEFCGIDWWDSIDVDDDCFLRHFDDYDGFNYYCIDGVEIIVTEFCGDVVCCRDFDAFLRDVESLLNDDREDR